MNTDLTELRELQIVRVCLDISRYWLKDEAGELRTVNSIYEEIRGTPDEVGRNTLRLALDGRLDRGYYSHAVKLSRLCSKWSGKKVGVDDILSVQDDEGDLN